MGSFKRQFRIPSVQYDEFMAEAANGKEKDFLRSVATNENGRYHDPQTQAWVEGAPERNARVEAWLTAVKCVETFLLETLPLVVDKIPEGEEVTISVDRTEVRLSISAKGIAPIDPIEYNIPF